MKTGHHPTLSIKNNVAYFLKKHAQDNGDKVAFYFKSNKSPTSYEQITYAQLYDKTIRFAKSLHNLGIKQNENMIVVAPISVELYIALVGLQVLGAVPVLIDSITRKDQLISIMQNANPIGIISLDTWLPVFKEYFNNLKTKIQISNNNFWVFDSQNPKGLLDNGPHKIKPVNQEQTGLLTYTTGSSGTPKGVNRTHRFLCAQHCALKRLFPYKNSDIDLPVFPVFTLNNLASGISTVIPAIDVSRPTPKDPEILLSQIEECKVTCMTLAPSSLKSLTKYCNKNNKSLQHISRVLTGGAPISETDISNFTEITPNSKNWILYGSTEVEPISYIEAKEMLSTESSKIKNVTKKGVNVGKIDEHLKYEFINIGTKCFNEPTDLSTLKVKKGEVGELVVTGENVCKEYYKNAEAFTRSKIIDKNGAIWHRTGDLARIDDNDSLWIVGRKHNVIKYKNDYLFPVQPEILLKNLSFVSNAAYIDLNCKNKQTITAVVTLNENNKDKNKCKDTIFKTFRDAKIPLDKVVYLEKIPMDVRHHSKVNYNDLRQELNEKLK